MVLGTDGVGVHYANGVHHMVDPMPRVGPIPSESIASFLLDIVQ